MKVAVLKIGALGVLSLLGLASAVGATWGTGGPVDTVTSVISSVGSQTGSVVTATGAVTDPASTGAGSDPTSTVGDAAGSTAGGAGGRAAPRVPRLRTTFDRLPRRLEALLERIVLGQEPGANLRRLEQALRAGPPQLRARVLRLLRAEMRRLKQGGPYAQRARPVQAPASRPGGAQPLGLVFSNPQRQRAAEQRSGDRRTV